MAIKIAGIMIFYNRQKELEVLNRSLRQSEKSACFDVGSNPNGYFSLSCMGKTYKGFLHELKVKPAENQKQEWALICHPETSI
jgi:hypothetical protein